MIAALVVVTTLAVGIAVARTPATAYASTCDGAVFSNEWQRSLDAELSGLAYTAAVFDTASGCWYELNSDVTLTTASAVKLQVLAANLDRAESLGQPLTAAEIGAANRMLWFSHNSPSTSLLYERVGTAGMVAFSDAVGATSMRHSLIYGITTTSAADLTRSSLATLNFDVDSPLTVESRAIARELLVDVHFTQRWGISAGLPADHEVWLKNGFFPCTSCGPFSGTYTWRVASTGYVERPDQTGWAISVLTDGSSSQQQGIDAVEVIASHVSQLLAEGSPASRPIDDANCTTVESADGATSITMKLGLERSDWTEVLWVSGNEGPLLGQLMCAAEALDGVRSCICPGVSESDNRPH